MIWRDGRLDLTALQGRLHLAVLAQAITADSPDLVAAKRLLDAAKQGGFRFVRGTPGPDDLL